MKPLEQLAKGLISDKIEREIEGALRLVKDGHKDLLQRLDAVTDRLEDISEQLQALNKQLR